MFKFAKMLSQEGRTHDLSGLQSSISDVATCIHPDNQRFSQLHHLATYHSFFLVDFRIFLKHIETPLALIQSGMDPSEALHPFSVVTKSLHRTKNDSKS